MYIEVITELDVRVLEYLDAAGRIVLMLTAEWISTKTRVKLAQG